MSAGGARRVRRLARVEGPETRGARRAKRRPRPSGVGPGAWLLWLALSSSPGMAETLVYGGDRAFAPFEFVDGNGVAQGFQVELLREMARAGGFEVDIRLEDWGATEAAFRAGARDLIAMAETRERKAWAWFAKPHATPVTGIYHRRGTAAPVSLADMAGRTIAVDARSEAMRQTREAFLGDGEYRFLAVEGVDAALRAVRDGRADFALAARAYGDAALGSGGFDGVVAADFQLRLQAYAFAVRPGNEALRVRLDAALDVLRQSGKLEELSTRWLGSHRDAALRQGLEKRLWRETWFIATLVALAVPLVAWLVAAIRRYRRRLAAEQGRRRAVEAQLEGARARFDQAFRRHPDAMLVTQTGRVVEVNPAFCRLFDCAPDTVQGSALARLEAFTGSDAPALAESLLEQVGAYENLPFTLGAESGRRHFIASGARIDTGAAPQAFVIVREITAHLAADRELRQEVERLEAVMREQGRALAQARDAARRGAEDLQGYTEAVTHDLRAPLRLVGGFAGLMRDNLAEADVAAALASLDHIERAAERMDTMLTDLGRLARLGREPLLRQSVDMHGLAGQAWAMVDAQDSARRVECRIAPMPAALGDAGLLAQVWQNLLQNARKFSSRSAAPKVAVDAHVEDGVTWFRVTDNGAGFDMGQAARMFQPFQRLHAGEDFQGTGLGLSIVRRIVEAHGGAVRSRGQPGVGAVFEFSLAPPAPPGRVTDRRALAR